MSVPIYIAAAAALKNCGPEYGMHSPAKFLYDHKVIQGTVKQFLDNTNAEEDLPVNVTQVKSKSKKGACENK